ncbi:MULTISPECIES: ArsR/SmtB family transcription factor [Actinomadura]|uniref:ArsR/SmtB family transcription factor n=1 Tax=Actinomadura yumaensis TaxID=111807 RepID=A0ABW2CHK3_9ACTN|nr:metalloregulator ArsR/SmtB family transcription factor [Actinomadura sp. J1-007]
MTTIDPMLRALAHPTRLRMMSLMWAAPQSATDLARELEISHALASHHLRRLDAAGLVELGETRVRKGGTERRYRAVHGTPLSDRGDATALLAETLAHNLRERAARRVHEGPGVTSDVELWLTPADWDALRVRMAALLADLHAAARPPHTPGTVGIGGTVMLFPVHEEPPPPGERPAR